MKQYSYYDAYHRQKKFPMMFRLYRLRGKRGVFLLSFFIAIIIVRGVLWEEITEIAGWSRLCVERMDRTLVENVHMFWYVLIRRNESDGIRCFKDRRKSGT